MARALGLIVVATLAAALYGALHNQISVRISHEYFTVLKFDQFGMPDAIPLKDGASIVGVLASWWVGAICGAVVALWHGVLGLRGRGGRAVLTVLLCAAIGAAAGLGLATAVLDAETAAELTARWALTDPLAFARVAAMHEGSYLGGLAGLVLTLISATVAARRGRAEG